MSSAEFGPVGRKSWLSALALASCASRFAGACLDSAREIRAHRDPIRLVRRHLELSRFVAHGFGIDQAPRPVE